MDYPCAKFGDFSFKRFGFIVRTVTNTERITHRITDVDDRIHYILYYAKYFIVI